MSLTLFGAPLSPFVRKTALCLLEKSLDYQQEMVSPSDPPEGFREISPLGRIPALKDNDLALADSSVICQYLEEKYPHTTPLYGANAEQRAIIRWLEKYADYELAALCTTGVLVNRVFLPLHGKEPDEAKISEIMHKKLPPLLDYLEATLADNTYFVGNALSMADLAIGSQLLSLEQGKESIDANRWPKLAAHFQRIKARPSVQGLQVGEHRILEKLGVAL